MKKISFVEKILPTIIFVKYVWMPVLIVFFSIVVICVHVFDVENNYPNVHSVDRTSYVLYVFSKIERINCFNQ